MPSRAMTQSSYVIINSPPSPTFILTLFKHDLLKQLNELAKMFLWLDPDRNYDGWPRY